MQPPSMMGKQVKGSKAKPEKKVTEAAESPAETSPVPPQPAQSIEGKFSSGLVSLVHYVLEAVGNSFYRSDSLKSACCHLFGQ